MGLNEKLQRLNELLQETGKSIKSGQERIEAVSTQVAVLEEKVEGLEVEPWKNSEEYESTVKRLGELEVQVQESKRKIGLELSGLDQEKAKDFKFYKVFRALDMMNRGKSEEFAFEEADAKFEHEILAETKKAMRARGDFDFAKAGHQVSVDSSGGLFVPAQVANDFIDVLRSRLVLEQDLGARVMTDLSGGSVWIPRQLSKTSVSWLTENGAPAESDIDFGQLKLEPRFAGAFVTISNMLLEKSPEALESIVREDMAAQMARHLQNGALIGSGGLEPRGLLNHPDIEQISLNAGAGRNFNFDDAEIMRVSIEEKDVDGEIGFLSRPTTWSLMKRLKVDHYSGQSAIGNQAYLLGMPPMSDQELSSRLGSSFAKTTSVPKTNPATGAVAPGGNGTFVIGGVWNQLILAFWSRLRLRTSREASFGQRSAFLQNETWIVVDAAFDSNVRRPEAFIYAADATQT